MDPEYSERLPNEIIEKILLDIPTYQLPINNSWVCKKWTNVILQIPFWVNKLKRCGINIDDTILTVLQGFENNQIVSCLYHACLYQEHLAHQTPITTKCTYILDDDIGDENVDSEEVGSKESFEYDNAWVISDNFDAMLMAIGILICRSIRPDYFACLSLKNEKISALPILLKLVEARKVPVYIRDDYAFWNFSPRINYLQYLKGNCDEAKILVAFRGCLLTSEGLPSSMSVNSLSIAVNEQGVAIDPGLSTMNHDGQKNLHLKAGTNISNLPDASFNALFVSDLQQSHILWMKEATKKFLKYESLLILLDYQLDLVSSENLLKIIAEEGEEDLRIFFTVKNEFINLASSLESLIGKYDNNFADLEIFEHESGLFEHLSCYFEIFFEDNDMCLASEIYFSKYGR